MEKEKILIVGLITLMMVFTAFIPVSKIVLAASTDTLVITFKFVGNKSIDVSLASYNFTTVWAGNCKNTSGGATHFTMWNNGTMVADISAQITTAPSGLTCHNHNPTGMDSFALLGLKGTIQYTPWYNTTSYQNLEAKLNKSQPRTFGLRLYAGNVSAAVNNTWKTMTVTFRAT
jgi:hypothetical protein